MPTLKDETEITVPEGTQAGTRFKLRGKGMPNVSGRGHGDLFVIARVAVPKKLTKRAETPARGTRQDHASIGAGPRGRRGHRQTVLREGQGHLWLIFRRSRSSSCERPGRNHICESGSTRSSTISVRPPSRKTKRASSGGSFSSRRRSAMARRPTSALSCRRIFRTSPIEVPDEDWARRSQQNLKAVTVDGLVIAPPWDVPGPRAATTAEGRDLPVVVIEPSTGFGTGHHATTRLCLRLLQQLELRGARVVDVGTGSGVLALAAWKLGAGDIVAVDNDPDALDNARANIARNGAGAAIDVVRDDLGQLKVAPADVVVANLTAALLVRHVVALMELIRRRGYLVLSGFAPPQGLVDVMPAYRRLRLVQELVEGDWQAVLLGTA